MLTSYLTRLVTIAIRRPVWIIVVSLLLAVLSGSMSCITSRSTPTSASLIETEPEWAARSHAIDEAFPQRGSTVLVVVEAQAPEFADAAANALAAALSKHPDRVHIGVAAVRAATSSSTTACSTCPPIRSATPPSNSSQARPLINALAHDPTLTGLAGTLNTSLQLPLQLGQVTLGDICRRCCRKARPCSIACWPTSRPRSRGAIAGRQVRTMRPTRARVRHRAAGGRLQRARTRRERVRRDPRHGRLNCSLAQKYGATVRLTGEQPLADEEFASVKDGAVLNGIVTFIVVLVILWLALRSGKMIVAVFITLFVGLAITAALGLMMVHALNMISVAFMVLFVGLGVDFGIQFGVQLSRGTLPRRPALDVALVRPRTACRRAAHARRRRDRRELLLVPADRLSRRVGTRADRGRRHVRRVSHQHDAASGAAEGFNAAGRSGFAGLQALAPVDEFLDRNRKPVLIGTLIVVIGALPLLLHLRFDFNPLHLKDPHTESMATLLSLKDAPEAAVNDVQVLAPSLADADQHRRASCNVAGSGTRDDALHASFPPTSRKSSI